ncbi:MAG: metal ABC transporter permease [Actinobacteria bacterium]|nr:metal ABC transporter permease [Actinomycetota bacterium]
MWGYGFAQRALVGGVLIAVTCSLLSFFVVVRRLAFVGMGISHAAFGGVALGLAAGVDPVLAAGGFCALVAVGIGWLAHKGRFHEDTVIGILFVTAMALGVVLVRVANAYNLDIMSYLFGSILALDWSDVALIAAVGSLALLYELIFFKELLFISFDRETAIASGLPVLAVDHGFLVMLSLVIVVSIKLVGIILVSALLVIPAATGMQLSRNYRGVMALSLVTGLAAVLLGLYVSFHYDVASGSAIVLVLFALFLLAFSAAAVRTVMRRRGGRG